MIYSANMTFEYKATVDEVFEKTCVQTKSNSKIQDDFQNLVNIWMCSPDCKCYSGEGQKVQKMWSDYGDQKLLPYKRNAGTKNTFNDAGEILFPLKWTNDPSDAYNTFKECYEKVLKPKEKYSGNFDESVDSFFDGGGYEFFSELEQTYQNCASGCKPTLFYLTLDINKGMPTQECI